MITTAECFRYLTYFTINDTDSLQSDGHSLVQVKCEIYGLNEWVTTVVPTVKQREKVTFRKMLRII